MLPRFFTSLFLLCVLAGVLPTPSSLAASNTPVSPAEWRSTFGEIEAKLAPKEPDFLRQLWNWADNLFRSAKAVGEGREQREKGRIALIEWTILESYIVQRQGTTSLDGVASSQSAWEEQVRVIAHAREQANETFGPGVMKESWANFVIVCKEQGWAIVKSPFSTP